MIDKPSDAHCACVEHQPREVPLPTEVGGVSWSCEESLQTNAIDIARMANTTYAV